MQKCWISLFLGKWKPTEAKAYACYGTALDTKRSIKLGHNWLICGIEPNFKIFLKRCSWPFHDASSGWDLTVMVCRENNGNVTMRQHIVRKVSLSEYGQIKICCKQKILKTWWIGKEFSNFDSCIYGRIITRNHFSYKWQG